MSHFIPLIKREWIINRRDMRVNVAVVFLFLLVSEVLQSIVARYSGMGFAPETYGRSFVPFLLIGGVILATMLFNQDLFKKENQHTFLMLPASRFEKFFSKTVLIIIGYPVALTAIFFLSSVIIEIAVFLFFGNPIHLFNPFAQKLGSLLLQYWVSTSFFILGGTLFRKAPFIKTGLFAIVLVLVGVALGLLFFRVLITLRMGGDTPMFVAMGRLDSTHFISPPQRIKNWIVVSKILFMGVLPLGALVSAYLRVGEVEAIDAV